MDYHCHQALRTLLLLSATTVLATGCPDDPVVPSDTETGTAGATGTVTETGGACEPGQTLPCACPDGGEGTQTCMADGSGLGPCECDGTSLDTGSTSDEPGTTSEGSTTGPTVGCTTDEDCAELPVGECEAPVCNLSTSMCRALALPVDTPCGDASSSQCDAPDSCDGAGHCRENLATEGAACEGCGEDECTCAAGSCGSCSAFAPANNFTTTRSIEGWELTGSWGLHRQAPQSQLEEASEFPGQVLGSDGNRVAPFPGAEVEASYARTSPTVLPAMIVFLSWHVDEGGGASDNKTVRVSVDDGVTWDTLADCAVDASWPFCVPSAAKDPAVFDLVQIPVPAGLVGQLGRVEFGYDTGDACCDFEKGWFIDSLNVATQCVCVEDADCAAWGTECGTPYCTAAGECALMGLPDDTACGDPFENDCNGADLCDGVGYCRDNLAATGLALCGDCPGGSGCSFCDAGQCLDCMSYTDFSDFSDPVGVSGWTVQSLSGTADWGLYDFAPQSQDLGSVPLPFPNAPVYGTDGNRQAPYPGEETEDSQVTTAVGVVPAQISFMSWNVDEGSFVDGKRVELSVDGGATWNTLVDCQGLGGQPFCDFVSDRPADDWDLIVLDTSAWQGMPGQLRFVYETLDSCCGFERGWFIDDLSFAAFCDDEPFGT
jgi:hypothetical protein